jgi:hypothetical protein
MAGTFQQATLQQLSNYFYNIAQADDFIKGYYFGPKWDINENSEPVYPLLAVIPQPSVLKRDNMSFVFDLYCVDLNKKDVANRTSISSDCLQTLLAIKAYMNKDFSSEIFTQVDSDLEPQWEMLDDDVSGWRMRLVVDIDWLENVCIEPGLVPTGTTFQFNSSMFDVNMSAYVPIAGNVKMTGPLSGISSNFDVILSASTNLYDIFATASGAQTLVQPGSNILTGGTLSLPIISLIASPSVNGFSASGNSIFNQTNAAKILSAGTDLYSIFLTTNDGNDITRVQPGSNIVTGGTDNFPVVSVVSSPSFNGIVASGSSSFQSLSATTFVSGSTNLYNIFSTTDNNDITRVEPGSNIVTGGTGNFPVVSLIASPSINSLTASGATSLQTVSATTFVSGSTNLYNIFSTTDNNDITRVEPGSNITTGGTDNFPVVSLISSPSVNGFSASGNSFFQGLTGVSISATTLCATTFNAGVIKSGGTDLYSIFLTTNDGNDITRVQPGSNILTAGTGNFPVVSLIASPSINSLTASGSSSFQTLSATTFISGSTNLYNIFSTTDNNDITRVQPGSNIVTGGTDNFPVVSVVASPSFNALTASGATSLQTLSATTFISGSTNLYNIFALAGSSGGASTAVQAGSNITTGGTQTVPIISVVASPSLNGLTWSGVASGNTFSANTVSASTIYSASTNLYSIFSQPGLVVNNINAGSNITTGGTSISPTINVAASPSFNALTLSGAGQFAAITATSISGGTVSGGTLYSGTTELSSALNTLFDITNLKKGNFGITVDGAGSVPLTGFTSYVVIPYSGTITSWNILADQSGVTKFDIFRNGVSIIGASGNYPLLNNETGHTANVTSWTSTAIAAGDTLQFDLWSAQTVNRINLFINLTK